MTRRPSEAPESSIAIVARDVAAIVASLEPERRPFVAGYATPSEVPAGDAPVVVLVVEDLLGEDATAALQRIRGQRPAAKFVFLAAGATEARARALAPWGAVLSEQADGSRLEHAIRHAGTLATMAAEMKRLRQTGRFQIPPSRPPDGE